MKPLIIFCTAFTLLASQAYYALGQGFDMQAMQQLQAEREEIMKQRTQERKAIAARIAEEELARARQEQAATGTGHDPHAVAEMRTKEKIMALQPQWDQEDRELDTQVHSEMMKSMGMGNQPQMQQQMIQQYGQHVPVTK